MAAGSNHPNGPTVISGTVYHELNTLLSRKITHSSSLTDAEFTEIIEGVRGLTPPDSDSKRDEFNRSRLKGAFTALASAIARGYDIGTGAERARRLRTLVTTCMAVVGHCLGAQEFASFFVSASFLRAHDPLLPIDIANDASKAKIPATEFSWSSPERTRSTLVECARQTVLRADVELFDRAMSAFQAFGMTLSSENVDVLVSECVSAVHQPMLAKLRDLGVSSTQIGNPYANANQVLYSASRNYHSLNEDDFGLVLTALRRLPEPIGENRPQFEINGIVRAVTFLAGAISKEASSDQDREKVAVHVRHLRELWNASRATATQGFGATDFVYFFISASRTREQDAVLPIEIATEVALRGIPSRDFKWTDSTQTQTTLLHAGRHALATADCGLFEQVLSSFAVLGVERTAQTWRYLASACVDARSRDLLTKLWAYAESEARSWDAPTWGALIKAAGDCENEAVLRRIIQAWTSASKPSGPSIIGMFASASREIGELSLLDEVIKLALALPLLTTWSWGALLNAAGSLNDESSFRTLWLAWRKHPTSTDSVFWGSVASACADLGQKDLLVWVWSAWQNSGDVLSDWTWYSFARAAGECMSPELLLEMFETWSPWPGTLEREEHPVWASFFTATLKTRRPDLSFRLFQRLDELFDPTLFRHRGTLDPTLWSLVHELGDRQIAADIKEHLSGNRLNVDRCFEILSTVTPAQPGAASGQFEGAGRCLMRWLINQFFRTSSQEFASTLEGFARRIHELPIDRTVLWHALIARSQETYAGCLRQACLTALDDSFGYLEGLSVQELLAEVRKDQGGVVGKIVNFLSTGMAAILERSKVETGALEPNQEAIIEYLCKNQREYYRREPSTTANFFQDLRNLIRDSDLGSSSESEAVCSKFLPRLFQCMTDTVWNALFEPFRARIHGAKNRFIMDFGDAVRDLNMDEDRSRNLAVEARRYLSSLGAELHAVPVGEIKPISIVSVVKHHLVGWRHALPGTSTSIPTPFSIAGWDGVRQDVFIPLLVEIRSNAEEALTKLPPEDQLYEVSLMKGVSEDEGYAVLTVANAWNGTREGKSSATGIGVAAIQRWAGRFSSGTRRGYAYHESEMRGDRLFWVWRIFLPLLEE